MRCACLTHLFPRPAFASPPLALHTGRDGTQHGPGCCSPSFHPAKWALAARHGVLGVCRTSQGEPRACALPK